MRALGSSLLLAFVACRGAPPSEPPSEPTAREPAPAATAETRPSETRPSETQPADTQPTATPPVESPPPVAARPREPHSPTPPGDGPLPVYDRHAWKHWIDADGDCQDTRTEVLVAESLSPVVFTDAKKCEVASGQWRCPYTDRTFSDPRQLDVDHMVPLAEAHRSGGARWSAERRRDYANDLVDPEHLVAVYKGANRSKGAQTIAQWLPQEPGSRCAYVETWLAIKAKWKLSLDEAERAAARDYLEVCAAGGVPEVGRAVASPREHERPATPAVTDPSQPCCRHCKSGKPCGDACIAADKVCRKPPGCACGS